MSLAKARYGKDKVRVFRVVRGEGGKHDVAEYTVRALLEGDIETSYTQADNSVVVATDSIKNTIYVLAKTSPHVLQPELFALHIAAHFVTKYAHIHRAYVDIEKLKWTRIAVDGKEHEHSFVRDGEEKVLTSVEVSDENGKDKLKASVKSGVQDLLVLKSSGSAFENFVRDEYTTLVDVDDRIFSTAIDLEYSYTVPSPISIDSLGALGDQVKFNDVAASARKITLDVFATDNSASVQATLFKMAGQIIAANETVASVSYSLPNKHYIPVDLGFFKLDNTKPKDAEVFVPIAAPSGLIQATVTR